MSLKELVTQEVQTLEERELQSVAEYVSFLKFRARAASQNASEDAHLSSLYAEFEREDRALAETDMDGYALGLSREDAP